MSRVLNKKRLRQKRTKQGDKIAGRKRRRSGEDDLAMISAGVHYQEWAEMPEHQRQLHRFRARQAMAILEGN